MQEKIAKAIKISAIVISASFIVFALVSKQYAFAFVGAPALIGFLLIFRFSAKLREKHVVIPGLLVLAMIGSLIAFGFLARGTLPSSSKAPVWGMRTIDNPGYLIPNGLEAYDVDGNGHLDYLTNYEWDGYIRIAFHPGLNALKSVEKWESITIGHIDNAENVAFGDFDADGKVDVVVCSGEEMGAKGGIKFIWGPGTADAKNPSKWIQSDLIPNTISAGQFHYIESFDMNGDGVDDIVVGGRGAPVKAGIRWIEAPANQAERRDVTKWVSRMIDEDLESGHGFEIVDLNNDGFKDLVLCNSDWDTKPEDMAVIVYQNPGTGTETQKQPWPKHVIYKGTEFYSKEHVDTYDLDGDGFKDVAMQTVDHVYLFKNPGNLSLPWNLTKINKLDEIKWRGRPIAIGDLNGDGKAELVGGLIHRDGYLPENKAAIFYLQYSGTNPFEATWELKVIKWADGFFGIGKWNGEKWDNIKLIDVDNDGDLDIVANVEEFHTFGFCFMSVVWFENML